MAGVRVDVKPKQRFFQGRFVFQGLDWVFFTGNGGYPFWIGCFGLLVQRCVVGHGSIKKEGTKWAH